MSYCVRTKTDLKRLVLVHHFRLVLVPCCILGFLYQIREHVLLYWTYPVVVDIQSSTPVDITLPAISFCNINGIEPLAFCRLGAKCYPPFLFYFINPCTIFTSMCVAMNDSMGNDFHAVTYHKLMHDVDFSAAMLAELKKPVEDFFKCKIVSSRGERPCKTADALIGSYYSDSKMFSSCYTINSLWSQPNKELQRVKGMERLVIEFKINISDRILDNLDTHLRPRHNYPVAPPTVRLSFHTNHASISPFTNGMEFLGGKRYQIRLQKEVKHLLPSPYQTNCTDYLTTWKARGGRGPLNEMMVVEECKYNLSMELLGCVPFTVDYPHNETVCKECNDCPDRLRIDEKCSKLVEQYNQPCDFVSYEMKVTDKPVFIEKTLKNSKKNESESIVLKQRAYDCTHGKPFTHRCQFVYIEVLFDDFESTTTTFKPKMESAGLVSVIGGYMGIYLGIAMVTVYDIFEEVFSFVRRREKKTKKEKHHRSRKKRKHRRSATVRPRPEN